ncbi:transcription factor subunit Med10 of mediator complex-domain-containing protein [Xylariaceae sp. FL0255]|nr:transcription factor subunit Med10 of mediator complex-domain-containing protein [Xylariaceae sp. FL0255]
MAPLSPADHNALEQQLKDTIQSLHNIMIQTTTYDSALAPPSSSTTTNNTTANANTNSSSPPMPSSRPSREVLASELAQLSSALQAVHRMATTKNLPRVPPELVQYVDNGRNPDIYTREFVELVRRGNQLMRGKQRAFASFRDVLAAQIESALPELRDDAARVVAATSRGGEGAESGDGQGGGATLN